MNAGRVQNEVGVFMCEGAGAIRSCGRKDDVVDRFRAEEERIGGCARAERSIRRRCCELEHSNRAVVFESRMGSERAGCEEERSQLLESQSDRLAVVLTELGVNMEMGAADQGPSAIGSPAAERRESSQRQDGKVLHDQTIAGLPRAESTMAVTVHTSAPSVM